MGLLNTGRHFKRFSWYLNLGSEFIHRVNKSVPLRRSVLVILNDPIAKRTKPPPTRRRKREYMKTGHAGVDFPTAPTFCWVWRERWQTDRRDEREGQRTRGGKRRFEQGWTKITPRRPIMKEMGYEREASSTVQARRGVRDCNPRWILAPIQKLGQRPSTNTDTQTLIQPPVNAASDLPFSLTYN